MWHWREWSCSSRPCSRWTLSSHVDSSPQKRASAEIKNEDVYDDYMWLETDLLAECSRWADTEQVGQFGGRQTAVFVLVEFLEQRAHELDAFGGKFGRTADWDLNVIRYKLHFSTIFLLFHLKFHYNLYILLERYQTSQNSTRKKLLCIILRREKAYPSSSPSKNALFLLQVENFEKSKRYAFYFQRDKDCIPTLSLGYIYSSLSLSVCPYPNLRRTVQTVSSRPLSMNSRCR